MSSDLNQHYSTIKNKMRIFLICIALLFTGFCKAQKNQNLQSDILSFFKINDKDIENCKTESEKLRKEKTEEWIIENIYDQCITYYQHFNFYKDNTLKMLEKTSDDKDFFIVNYISDNITIPFDTKTILNTDKNYYGLRHFYDYINDKSIEKNEDFEVSQSDIDNLLKIEEYLKIGRSEYVGDKSAGLIGANTHWYIVARNNGKVRMIELFRIK